MRETLCAIAIVTLVCVVGSGLEAARTAERLELILGSNVSVVDALLLPDAQGLVERLEGSARFQSQQAELIAAARHMKEQSPPKLAGAEP